MENIKPKCRQDVCFVRKWRIVRYLLLPPNCVLFWVQLLRCKWCKHALQCGIILVFKTFFFYLFSCHFGHYHMAHHTTRLTITTSTKRGGKSHLRSRRNSSEQEKKFLVFRITEPKPTRKLPRNKFSVDCNAWKTCCMQWKLPPKLNMDEIDEGTFSEACVEDFMCLQCKHLTVDFVSLLLAVCRHFCNWSSCQLN